MSLLSLQVSLVDASGDVDRESGVSALVGTLKLPKQTVMGLAVNPHLG
jgi:hypothetical protein